MRNWSDQRVTVYAFEYFDVNVGDTIVPPFKATDGAIRAIFKGKPLPLTGEAVDESEVDHEGRWFRVATGWGQLG